MAANTEKLGNNPLDTLPVKKEEKRDDTFLNKTMWEYLQSYISLLLIFFLETFQLPLPNLRDVNKYK